MTDDKPKSKRGFAGMTPEKRSEIASLGGKAARDPKTRGFALNPDLAARAGAMGGRASKRPPNPKKESES